MQRETDRTLIEQFLKRLPVFRSLNDDRLRQLVAGFSTLRRAQGETVFNQADESTDLYIVIRGRARASLVNEDGQELVLAEFREGDFFGEMSLLDGRPRSATIIAEEDMTLGVLRREVFLGAVKKDPMIAIDLLSALVQRLRSADEMIESLAFLDVSQRLLRAMVQLAKEEGGKSADGQLVLRKYTHKELAGRVGASREAVSKVLKVLAFRKLVRDTADCFLISPDAEGLCQ